MPELAVVSRRVVRAILPPRRDGDPLFEKRMPAKLAQAAGAGPERRNSAAFS